MKKLYFREARVYTGCQEDVAEALKVDQSIICKVWDGNKANFCYARVTAFCQKQNFPYSGVEVSKDANGVFGSADDTGDYWKHAEPIPKKQMVTFVKSEVELLRLFLDKGYTKNRLGAYAMLGTAGFTSKMWQYCGKPKPSDWSWESDWLEEKEV